jgi:hypothetical protein
VPPAGPFSVINRCAERRLTREVSNDVADKCDNLDNTSYKMIFIVIISGHLTWTIALNKEPKNE